MFIRIPAEDAHMFFTTYHQAIKKINLVTFSWTLDLSLGVLFSLLFCNSSFYSILSLFGAYFSSFRDKPLLSSSEYLVVKQERVSLPPEPVFSGTNFSYSPTEVLKILEQPRRSCSAVLGTGAHCPHPSWRPSHLFTAP